MKINHLFFTTIFAGFISIGVQAQVLDQAMKLIGPDKAGLTEKDAAGGIREALIKGTSESVAIVSKLNGYYATPEIKIPFPASAREIETKLRAIGLGSKVDEAVLALNRAAEDAAKEAEPIFIAAVKQMSISDAITVVKGKNDAATRYLASATTPELKAKIGRAHV